MPTRASSLPAILLASLLLSLLAVPMLALALAATPADLEAGARNPLFVSALWLSVRTTVVSLGVVVLTGTPLAWWLATRESARARAIEIVVDLPIVVPPAVLGVALLQAFGRRGLLGPALDAAGISLPFTTAAVVVAQVVVSAPFYVQAAANAFREVSLDLMVVARTLGATPTESFFRVAVPIALPGLAAGAALAWARALGEFGATLLFAGSLPGVTQTMPLAIYAALESDVRVAVAISLALVATAVMLLFGLRIVPTLWRRRRATEPVVDRGARA